MKLKIYNLAGIAQSVNRCDSTVGTIQIASLPDPVIRLDISNPAAGFARNVMVLRRNSLTFVRDP